MWNHPAYRLDCAGRHASDFKVGGPHRAAMVNELRDRGGPCHKPSEHGVRKRDWKSHADRRIGWMTTGSLSETTQRSLPKSGLRRKEAWHNSWRIDAW